MFGFKGKTLSQVIEDFLFAKTAERYSPATVHTYEVVLNLFKKSVGGDIRFSMIEAADVRRYLGGLSDLSDKTISNYHIVLSSLWTWAIENELASENVVHKIKKPKYTKKRALPFTESEVRKILRACRNKRDRAIVMVLLDSGMRASELINLTIDDWIESSLRIRQGKGKKSRIVPVTRATENAIFSQLGKRRISEGGLAGGDAIFASNISGKAMNYNALRSVMERLGRLSSVPDIHAHRFRHTFAITFLRGGGDIYTLKRILGHSTLEMVQNYLDIVRSDVVREHQKASPVNVWHLG